MLSTLGYSSHAVGRTNSNNSSSALYNDGRYATSGRGSTAAHSWNAHPSSSSALPRSSSNNIFNIYRRDRSTSPTPRSRRDSTDNAMRTSSSSTRGGSYPTINESSSYYQNYEARQSRSRSFSIVPAGMKDAFVYEASIDSRPSHGDAPDSDPESDSSSMHSITATGGPSGSSFFPSMYSEPESMYAEPSRLESSTSTTGRAGYSPPLPTPPSYISQAPPQPILSARVAPPPAPPSNNSSRSSGSSGPARRPSLSLSIPPPAPVPETRPLPDLRPIDNGMTRTTSRMSVDPPVAVVRGPDRPQLQRANTVPTQPPGLTRQLSEHRPHGARRGSDPVIGTNQQVMQASPEIRVQEPMQNAPRCVRWNEELICPSPILPSQRPKGWFNRRGDQLWTNCGKYRPAPQEDMYPRELTDYPEYGDGWMNEEGTRIDMEHRLIPKPPLRSALKQKSVQKTTRFSADVSVAYIAVAANPGSRSE